MQTAFAESILHKPHRVMGARLRPFCAAHFAFLDAIDNPMASFEADRGVTPQDVLVAVKVCSIAPVFECGVWQIPADQIRFTIADHFRCFRLASPALFAKAMREWEMYHIDYCSLPARMDTPDYSPEPLSSPSVFAAVVSAMKYLPEGRAWTMPINTLFTYGEIRAELSGSKIKFQPSEKEQARILKDLAEAERIGQELLKERLAKCQN
jgi:hypothetical protein